MLEVVTLNKGNELAYNDFIYSQSTSMLYHTLPYRDLLKSLLNCEESYLLCICKNSLSTEIKGVLPVLIKAGKLGKVYNSLPFYGSNGGLLTTDVEARSMLIASYQNLIHGGLAATIITSPLDEYPQPDDLNFTIQDYRIGQLTYLPDSINDEDELLHIYHYKTRNMVRKAQKEGLTVKVDNSIDSIEFLYNIHFENMKDIGGKAKSKLFFDLFPNFFELGKDYNIYRAYLGQVPVASMLLFYHNETIEYYTPVIKHEYRDLQPLSLLIFQGMLDGISEKYKIWNWGGTWESQESVYRFKKRWGTTDVNYYYYTQILNNDIYETTKDVLLNEYDGFYTLPFHYLK